MFRPALRIAPQASRVARQAPRVTPRARQPVALSTRRFASTTPPPPPPPPSSSGGGGGSGGQTNHTLIILAAIAGLAGGVYYLLKPVSDAAYTAKAAVDKASSGAGQAADTIGVLAQSVLPPGVWAVYSHLSKQEGGINGLLSSLKDQDLEGALAEIKKAGGDDVKRIVEKVEKKIKDAKGNVTQVDWKSLAEELKGELPASAQKTVDLLIGQIPSKDDYDQLINKIKTEGEKKKKEIEAAASKVLQKVEQAKKEGKGQADAYLKGLKEAAPGDVDDLIKQIKDAAKSAGLPADTIESWLKTKVEDGKLDAEALAKQLEGQLRTATKFLPVEPKEIVAQVKQFSPSLAELLASSLKQANVVDDNLKVKK